MDAIWRRQHWQKCKSQASSVVAMSVLTVQVVMFRTCCCHAEVLLRHFCCVRQGGTR
jgi:hypothetical protein